MKEKQEIKKASSSFVKTVAVFLAGVSLALASFLVGTSSWIMNAVNNAPELAQNASNVSRDYVDKVLSVGQAIAGLPATIATSSQIRVGPQAVVLAFTANTVCTSRAISTAGQAIQISFGTYPASGNATTTPASGVGHIQAASTNVLYDSGTYGCGNIGIFGESASTTITVSEFR